MTPRDPAHAIAVFRALAETAPDASAVVDAAGAVLLTRGALDAVIGAAARALADHGAAPGDRVILVAPQGPATAVALLALVAALPVAPVAPGPAAALRPLIDRLRPRFLALAGEPGPDIAALAAEAGLRLLRFDPDPATGPGALRIAPPDGPRAPPRPPLPLAPAEATALILPTSGTTGRPKLVALTHAHLGHMARFAAATLALSEADRVVNPMPMHHVHGIAMGTILPLASGGSTVPLALTSGAAVLAAAARTGATWYTAVPTIHQDVVRAAAAAPPAPGSLRLRFARSSSSAMAAVTREGLLRHLGIPVYEGLGMTEAASWVLHQPAGPVPRHGTVGRGQGAEIAVLGADGQVTRAPGAEGEMLIRGPHVITAYLEGDGSGFHAGWLRTGDRVRLTPEGEVAVIGRIKEMIDRGGASIAPVEVEELLLSHPDVAQAMAFGVPHPTLGQELAAAVVPRPGRPIHGAALRGWLSDRTRAELVPRSILVRSEIPLNAIGKPERLRAAEILGPELQGAPAAPEGPVEAVLADLMAELLPGRVLGRHDDLFLAGVDSLLLLRLQLRIEALFGAAPDGDAVVAEPTLAALARLLEQIAAPDALAALAGFWDDAAPAQAPRQALA